MDHTVARLDDGLDDIGVIDAYAAVRYFYADIGTVHGGGRCNFDGQQVGPDHLSNTERWDSKCVFSRYALRRYEK